jgi:predicted DCC family thiol-disulfide oxidoreductase YuxK
VTSNPAIMTPRTYPLTVFYDASCPLCAAEMGAMKARDTGDRLRLVDCSAPAFDDTPFRSAGITRALMMSRIHARTADGAWLAGIAVFAAVYEAAGLHVVARLCGNAVLQPLLDRAYPWIARNRQRLSRMGLARGFDRLGSGRPAGAPGPCASCAPAAAPRPAARDGGKD